MVLLNDVGSLLLNTSCWGTWTGDSYFTHILPVCFPNTSGHSLWEQKARLDESLVRCVCAPLMVLGTQCCTWGTADLLASKHSVSLALIGERRWGVKQGEFRVVWHNRANQMLLRLHSQTALSSPCLIPSLVSTSNMLLHRPLLVSGHRDGLMAFYHLCTHIMNGKDSKQQHTRSYSSWESNKESKRCVPWSFLEFSRTTL